MRLRVTILALLVADTLARQIFGFLSLAFTIVFVNVLFTFYRAKVASDHTAPPPPQQISYPQPMHPRIEFMNPDYRRASTPLEWTYQAHAPSSPSKRRIASPAL